MSKMTREDFDKDKEWKEHKKMIKRVPVWSIDRELLIECYYNTEDYEDVKQLIKHASEREIKKIAEIIHGIQEKRTYWYDDMKEAVGKYLKQETGTAEYRKWTKQVLKEANFDHKEEV